MTLSLFVPGKAYRNDLSGVVSIECCLILLLLLTYTFLKDGNPSCFVLPRCCLTYVDTLVLKHIL
jgi:hypothetical protein